MVATKLVTLGATLALATAVTASPANGAAYRVLRARDYQYLDIVPLEKRQGVTPERFQCHSDCGNTIIDSETAGYCDSSAWRSLLDACLECVVEHPIWQHYGEPVQAAAAGCGLSAEPGSPAAPIGGGDDDEEEEETTTAQPEPSTTQPPAPPVQSSTDAPAPTTTGAGAPEESQSEEEEEEEEEEEYSAVPSHTVPEPSHVPVPSNGTQPSHVPSAAGARVGGSFFAAGALAAAVYIL